MLKDELFLNKLKQKLNTSKLLILDSKIEGASLYRDMCKIMNNLISVEFEEVYDDDADSTLTTSPSKGDSESLAVKSVKTNRSRKEDLNSRLSSLEFFCNYLDIPQFFIEFSKFFISNKPSIKLLKEAIFYLN